MHEQYVIRKKSYYIKGQCIACQKTCQTRLCFQFISAIQHEAEVVGFQTYRGRQEDSVRLKGGEINYINGKTDQK
jgi:hypothetical protein